MTVRSRILGALALAAALLALPAGLAHADQAYDKVASAYAQAGGQLDPCAFTEDELKAAVRGIPPQIRDVVPDLRRAMVQGIATQMSGGCKGRAPEEGQTGGVVAPGTTTTPTTSAPATAAPPVTTPTETAPAAPVTTTPAPTTTAPAPAAAAPAPQPAGSTDDGSDTTPLLIALVAASALLLLALLLWGWARMRGWDPTWLARRRHAWGEAGFRTTSTWAEFTDWLRLGR